MYDNYFSFLDYRAARRRLMKKFARPRWLAIQIALFIAGVMAVWGFGTGAGWWWEHHNLHIATIVGALWSGYLGIFAMIAYERSAARTIQREEAVEEEMRQIIEGQPNHDHTAFFDFHQHLEADLERQARWMTALTAFSLINLLSWGVSALLGYGSSWPFQMTPFVAVFVIGGVSLYLSWRQQRQQAANDERHLSWFARLPLRHTFIYVVGSFCLWIAGAFHMINYWDAQTLIAYWSVLLLAQTGWNVIIGPLSARFMGKAKRTASAEKAKHTDRLVLGDDGEVLDIIDAESEQRRAHYSQE